MIAKVSSLDVEKKRLIVRLRSSECSLPNSDKDLVYRMFTQHLEEIEQYRQWAQTHGHIGTLLHMTINVFSVLLLCQQGATAWCQLQFSLEFVSYSRLSLEKPSKISPTFFIRKN